MAGGWMALRRAVSGRRRGQVPRPAGYEIAAASTPVTAASPPACVGLPAPVIDRKLRDLQDAGSARTGGLCRRFKRRP